MIRKELNISWVQRNTVVSVFFYKNVQAGEKKLISTKLLITFYNFYDLNMLKAIIIYGKCHFGKKLYL